MYGRVRHESLCGVRLDAGLAKRCEVWEGKEQSYLSESQGEDRGPGMAVTLHLEWRLFFAEIDLPCQSSHDIAIKNRSIGWFINFTDFLSNFFMNFFQI